MSRSPHLDFAHDGPAALLLRRLERVRRAGRGWSARCPAHEDRSASLSVAEGEGGRVLVHCFAGCPVADVVAAVGLELSDLFPPREEALTPQQRRAMAEAARHAQWAAALNVLHREAVVVEICARQLGVGKPLAPGDLARLRTAVERVESARLVLR